MPAAENRAEFLRTQDFASAATYDGATPVNVIFDEAYIAAGDIGSTDPVAWGNAADFPKGTCIGKTLLIGSTTYVIRERQPVDDGAFVQLDLEEQ
jgi:hypothetical protein